MKMDQTISGIALERTYESYRDFSKELLRKHPNAAVAMVEFDERCEKPNEVNNEEEDLKQSS